MEFAVKNRKRIEALMIPYFTPYNLCFKNISTLISLKKRGSRETRDEFLDWKRVSIA